MRRHARTLRARRRLAVAGGQTDRRGRRAPRQTPGLRLRTRARFFAAVLACAALAGFAAPASAQMEVPSDWALIPSDLGSGDQFRLLIVTSTRRDANSADIGDYDTHVRDAVAAGHASIRSYSSQFKVLASTATVNARDHTGTTGAGVPIYWLGGDRVADGYADFYDGSWDSLAPNDENGATARGSVWTGSRADGTMDFAAANIGLGLGGSALTATYGIPDLQDNQLDAGSESKGNAYSLYGLSPVFQVAAANAAPTFTSPATADVVENTTAVLTVVAEDSDAEDDITGYTLTGGADQLKFAIDATSGALTFATAPDYENPADVGTNNSYVVIVQATSGAGDRALTAEQTITVTVTDAAAPSAPTNFAARRLSTARAQLTFGAPPDGGLAITGYEYRVQRGTAAFGSWTALTATQITNERVNLSGLTAGALFTFELRAENAEGEGAAASTTEAMPTAPGVVRTLAAQAGDTDVTLSWEAPAQDGGVLSELGYQWRSKAGGGNFGSWSFLNAKSVIVDSLTNDVAHTFEVRAAYDVPLGFLTGLAASVTETPTAAVANAAPTFDDGDTTTREVAENTAEDQSVGDAVTATDTDAGAKLSYTLGGTDAASFDIDSETGQIKTKAVLDFETKSTYTVTVTVSDGTDTDSITVTINVTDIKPPQVPQSPSVSDGTATETSLEVRWQAPPSDGGQELRYDIRYRKSGAVSWNDGPQDVAGKGATITGLEAGTDYEVQVRATTTEGDSGWSSSVVGTTDSGDPTVTIAAAASVSEADDVVVFTLARTGATTAKLTVQVRVTQQGDVLANAAVYANPVDVEFGTGEGNAKLVVALDDDSAYDPDLVDPTKRVGGRVTAAVQAGTGYVPGAVSSVMVDVIDDEDPPLTAALTLEPKSPVAESVGTVAVVLTVETDAGARQPRKTYGATLSSRAGTASVADGDYQSLARDVRVAASDFVIVRTVWRATERFTIQIHNDDVDEEDETFRVITERPPPSDRSNLPATDDLTVTIVDDDDVSGAPTTLAATPGDAKVTLSWGAPSDAGTSSVTGYEYRQSGDGGSTWGSWTAAGDALEKEVTGLTNGTEYTFEVRAVSAAGDGAAERIAGTPAANAAPTFTSVDTANVEENTTAVLTVVATDTDAEDDITGYALTGGADQAQFAIDGSSGALTFVDAPDYENPTDAEPYNSYVVIVQATGGTGSREMTAEQTITVTVTDDDTEAPGAPDAPTFPSATASSLTVNWSSPTNAGPAITDYDVRWRVKGSGATWTEADDTTDSTDLTATITGLAASTEYEVQVRAQNAEGAGEWSASGYGTTDAATAPAITSVAFTNSPALGQGEYFKAGDVVDIAVTWDAAVQVTTTGGTPSVRLLVGSENSAATDAAYAGGAGTATLTFRYRAAAGHKDNDGLSVPAGSVALNGGTIVKQGATVAAGLSHTGVATDSARKVDGIAPTVFAIAIQSTPALMTHVPNSPSAPIDWLVLFTEEVVVMGRPYVEFILGTATKRAEYSDIMSNVVAYDFLAPQFVYSVVAGDLDTDGVNIEGNPVRLNGGSIRDKAGNDAVLDHDASSSAFSGHKVDGVKPVLQTAAVTGATLTLAYNEDLDTDSAPPLSAFTVAYASGTAPTVLKVAVTGQAVALTLSKAVLSTDMVTLSYTAPAGTGATPIRDAVGNAADNFTNQAVTNATTNTAPTFPSATTTRDVAENTAAGQNVGAAVTAADADAGDTLAYSLEGTGAASFGIDGGTGQIKTKAALDHETKASYAVTVKATDRAGATATVAVTISVTDDDTEAPAAPAAPTFGTATASSLAVNWAAPTNAGPAITDYDVRWRVKGSGATWTEADDTTDSTDLFATITGLAAPTEYEVQVRAQNDEGTGEWSASGDGTTDAAANAAPRFTSSATADVEENTTAVLTVVAMDSDAGDSITGYALAGGADQSQFAIDATSGALTFVTAPDFENPTDTGLDNTYVVIVRATSGTGSRALTADQTITATVTDATEAPGTPNTAPMFVAGLASEQSVAENTAPGTAIGSPYTATDADADDTLTWSLEGPDAASFAIDTSTGQLKTKASLDFETKSSYVVTVRVSDGTASDTIVVRIAVTAMNARTVPGPVTSVRANIMGFSLGQRPIRIHWDAPASNGGSPITGYEVLSFFVPALAQASWRPVPATQTSYSDYAPDFTLPHGVYDTAVRAINAVGKGPIAWLRVRYTGDTPTKPGPPSGLTATPGLDSVTLSWVPPRITGTADISHYDYRYRLGSAPVSGEWINIGDGAARTHTVAGLTGGQEYFFQVRARNSNGNGTYAQVAATPQAAVTTPGNNAPAFVAGLPSEQSVAENTPAGTAIGSPYTATDDDGDTLTWSLEGTDAASFAIDTSSGQLRTKAPLDYETKPRYVVTVRVSDGTDSDTIVVRIAVTAVTARTVPGPVRDFEVEIASHSGGANAGGIDMRWNPPKSDGGSDIISYEIKMGLHGSRSTTSASKSGSDRSHSAHNLIEGTWEIEIRARNAVGYGSPSVVHVRITSASPIRPGPPSGLTPTPGPGSVTLSWDPPSTTGTSAISHYDYRYQLGSAPVSGEWINIGDGAARTHTVTGLTGGEEHFFQVRARNGNGNGTYAQVAATPQAAVATSDNNAPEFSAAALAATTQSVVEYTASGTAIGSPYTATDADGDTLIWSLGGGTDAASFAIDTSTGQLRTKAALDYETKSSYVVAVRVSDGTDSATIVVRIAVTAVTVRTVPGPVRDFEVEIVSHSEGRNAGRIDMSWVPPRSDGGREITFYEIKIDLLGSSTTTSATKSGSDRSHSAHNLIEGTWEIEIRARNAVGLGSPSVARVRITSASPIRPGPPSGLTPTPGPGSVTLSWDPPSTTGTAAISHYDYRYQLGSAPVSGEWINIGDGAARTYTVAGLTGGQEYFFQVRARNSNGNGTYAQVAATPQAAVATPGNNAPKFSAAALAATTQRVAENTAAGTAIGSPYAATDGDGDTLAWSLGGGTDAASFAIDTSTGQLRTKAALDYETKSSYVVTVRVSDGTDSDTIVVRIAVTATGGRTVPGPVTDLEVEIVSHSGGGNAGRIDMSWDPPSSDGGSEITFYEIKIDRLGSSITSSAQKTGSEHSHSELNLTEGIWEVEIRARNAVGLGSPIVARVRITSASPIRPGPPSALTPTPGPGSVKLSWDPPRTTGTADISHYDYRYQLGSAPVSGEWINIGDGAARTYTVAGLTGGQEYFFQVRARNSNGNGTYAMVSATPRAGTFTNAAPVFSVAALAATTQSVAENTAADMAIGSPYTATDADVDDTLTYTLEGTDAASFAIDGTTGQLRTKAPLDYETKPSHAVAVKVSDGTDSATIDVTVTVTDAEEPPDAPDAPKVAATSGSATSLDVGWMAPDNTGPAIADYDYRYRVKTSRGSWTEVIDTAITVTSATITGLTASTTYQVQVRAENAEGASAWSESGEGTVNEPLNVAACVGALWSATMTVGDESSGFYKGYGGFTEGGSLSTNTFSYGETDYVVQELWFRKGLEGSGIVPGYTLVLSVALPSDQLPGFTLHVGGNAALGLAGAESRDNGKGFAWSDNSHGDSFPYQRGNTVLVCLTKGAVSTNAAPSFTSSATAEVEENTTAVLTVVATDGDADDDITGYTLTGGADQSQFAIEGSSGALTFATAPDYEDPTDAEPYNSYVVIVQATGGTGSRALTATQTITVTVTDDDTEAPGAPDAPTFPSATASGLTVNWSAPTNAGPAITDYDVRWRVKGSGATWTEAEDTTDSTDLTATITGLAASTEYEVQVRAENAEGTGGWSASGDRTTDAAANAAPTFTSSATAEVAENTTAVLAVVATDGDADDDITGYTLTGGADQAQFAIEGSSGALTFATAPDYENPTDAEPYNSYVVIVQATGGTGSRALTATQTITVTVTDDDTEAPGAPDAPTFPSATASGLTVNWSAPANAGPAITDYDVRWRVKGSGATWTEAEDTADSTDLTATITGLAASTEYEVQVRAENAEGTGGWSASGDGTTSAAPNNAPVFGDGATATRSVAESTAAGQPVGAPVAATDADGDTLTYSLGGTDADSFDIVATSGQLRTKSGVSYDYEAKSSYEVTLTVSDGTDTGTITVTIDVTDVDEPPATPAAPTVASATADSLTMNWTMPDSSGRPRIAGYDLRYRVKTPQGSWNDGPQNVDATTATITGLTASETYEAQVRARNDEGESAWSPSGDGTTSAAPNAAPTFTSSATAEVAENTTAVLTVVATDGDADDDITGYALTGGADQAQFAIEVSSGALAFATAPDYENPTGAGPDNTYVVIVRATSGTGSRALTAEQTVTVTVTDDDTEAPGAPAAPTFPSATASGLTVSWAAPANAGPAISDYDVRWRVKGSGATWTEAEDTADSTDLTATITGLAASTEYEVQVRAENAEGTGGWSASGDGTTSAAPNNAPVFGDGATATRSVAESTAAGQPVGAPVAATDADGDTLTYSLGGTDADSFDIVATSGQLRTKSGVSYDYEAKSSYEVTLTVSDGTDTGTITVTIDVTDVDEPPATPAAPTVASATADSLTMNWTMPDSSGRPRIAGYDLRYRVKTPQGSWNDGPQNVDATTATITGLTASETYEAQVRARNDEGESAWSPSGDGTTSAAPNAAPTFTSSATAEVAENTTAVLTVVATDGDADDDITGYALTGGADQAQFAIDETSGALTFADAPNFENPTDAEPYNSYVVIVQATSGAGDGGR